MKRIAIAFGGAIAGLLLLMLLATTMTAAGYPSMVQQINRLNDVPVELLEPLQDVAQAHQIPWEDLAAYLKVTRGYQVPVPTRVQLVSDWQVTPDQRLIVETLWRANVNRWLNVHVNQVGADLAARVPPERRQEFAQLREALRTGEQLRGQDSAAWERLTEGETYTPALALLDWPYAFPVLGGTFTDDWGFDRPQNQGYASVHHQGTDVFAPLGTPVKSAGDGLVTDAGWNYLGGWTVTVSDEVTGVRFYYAHLDHYATGMAKGTHVRQGALLGYVGTSGEGPEGTKDHIAQPHLHFGLYLPGGVVDPYPYLLKWRGQK